MSDMELPSKITLQICEWFYKGGGTTRLGNSGKMLTQPCLFCPLQPKCHQALPVINEETMSERNHSVNELAKEWKEANEDTHPLYKERRNG